MSGPCGLGPFTDADKALNELRRSVAQIIGKDPDTWPKHGNAPLAIAACVGLLKGRLDDATSSQSRFSLVDHIERQKAFSLRTFGPGARSAGVVDHIRKELREIEAAPHDLEEWVDVIILALDGAWRTGATPEKIVDQIVAKQTKNEGRAWPDWRTVPTDRAIEHDRSTETPVGLTEEQRRERFNAWFAQQPLPELLARIDPQQAAHNAFEYGFELALQAMKS